MEKSELVGKVASLKSPAARIWMAFLVAVLGVGAWAYYTQLTRGLIVTDMRDIVLWGLNMVTFIFFVGLNAGGLIICSSVCVFGAHQYRPIARLGALLAAVCIVIAAAAVIADLGRPDRLSNMIHSAQIQSPLI